MATTTFCYADSSFQLEEATIDSVHEALEKGSLTSLKLVEMYIERIAQYNLDTSRGAPINAIVCINPSIFDDARNLDEYYKKNHRFVGPLHAIPVIIKDNIDSIDTPSTSGSLSLLGSKPESDAFIVKKLKEAGAIIIGKGAMDEFGKGIFGISGRSGRIGNVYNPMLNPGGSSGGPAAAVSANFAMLGIGTDNGGSIRIPVALNGIYGLRPSTGLVSQSGIFPRWNLDGVAGPIARNIKDLAILLSVIARTDANDPKTLDVPRTSSYMDFLKEEALKNKKIGVIRKVVEVDPFRDTPMLIDRIYRELFAKIKDMGAEAVDIVIPEFIVERKNNGSGEVEDIDAYLASFPSKQRGFKDICTSDCTRVFGTVQECLKYTEENPKKGSSSYQEALNNFLKNRQLISGIMQENDLDALLMPITTNGTATYDPTTFNTWMLPISSNSGLPSLAIIAGYTQEKLPVGVELIGKLHGEGDLLSMAYAIEQASSKRPLPEMNPSEKLMNLDIPQLNELFKTIGQKTYDTYLKNENARDLTAEKFNLIIEETMSSSIPSSINLSM